MKNRVYILMLLCSFWVITYGQEKKYLLQNKISIEQLEQELLPEQTWVKYPSYQNREGWVKLLGTDREQLIAQGEKALSYQWQIVTATAYLDYERRGKRETMEKPLNQNISAIIELMVAELAEGKGRFMNALIDGVFHTCEMTSWVASAHMVLQPSHRSLPSHDNPVVDLVSGDISSMLSWVYYFFHEEFDKVDPEIAKRLKYELYHKTINPYMDGGKYWWMALGEAANGFVNNWNPWCNSNILQTALLLENDPVKRAEIVYKTIRSVDEFFAYIKTDGACEEGPSYWGHAAGKAYDYLQLLYDATDGKVSAFDSPMIKAMGEYICNSYIGNGWVVNFADAEARMMMDYYQIFKYGRALKSEQMMQFAAYLQESQPRNKVTSRDFYRMITSFGIDEEIGQHEAVHLHKANVWYPETEFYYLSRGDVFFASKGGHNDESHNHNDVGSFILYKKNQPLFIDAGVGTYTSKTFSSKRYELWSMQSNNHNVPMINGVAQKNGRKFKATDVVFNAKRGLFSTNIAGAYPAEAKVQKWQRSYEVSKRKTVITDSFEIEEANEVNEIVFVTWQKPKLLAEGKIMILVEEQNAQLNYDKATFSVSIEPIELGDVRFTKIWGEKIYKIVFRAEELSNHGQYQFTITY